MNVLLFISTLLLLMSMITYGRIQSYIGTMMVQGDLREGMVEIERCSFNNRIGILYENTHAKSNEPPRTDDENGQMQKPDVDAHKDAIAKINFRWMTEIQDPATQEIKTQMIQNLITELYKNEQFFQEMLLKRPDALNQVFQQLLYASAREGKIGYPKDLIKLKFDDEELWEFFSVMLRELPRFQDDSEDPCCFVSLLNYLTNRHSQKIRVYLAPKEILLAIFGSEEVVKRLIERRNQIFKEVKDQNAEQVLETGRKFQENFAGEAMKFLPLLDFSVSKSNPKGS